MDKGTSSNTNGKNINAIVYTDLDGSLLDHHTYSYQPAIPTLDKLAAENIPLVFNTSKTFAELLIWQKELNNTHPMIVENGSAIYIPKDYFSDEVITNINQTYSFKVQGDFYVLMLSQERCHWQGLIQSIEKNYSGDFLTFEKMGTQGIIESTGLSEDDAILANQRGFTEPVLWLASPDKKKLFIKDLKDLGANITEGGRFLHVIDDTDKGKALKILTELYEDQYKTKFETIAAGDGKNDVGMLLSADIGLMIKSPTHAFPSIPQSVNSQSYIIFSEKYGPSAWAEGIDKLIFDNGLKQINTY